MVDPTVCKNFHFFSHLAVTEEVEVQKLSRKILQNAWVSDYTSLVQYGLIMQKIAKTTGYATESARVPGDSLTDWALSDSQITPLPGRPRPMPDTVDYRFVNGWVATGELPCREALRRLLPSRHFALSDCPALPHLYCGGADPRVDFTTFRFTPDLIARWARCTVTAVEAGPRTFEAETCGGLRIWAAGQEVLVHEPYDRNIPHSRQVTIDLPAGKTVLTVRFDDLHERDTSCFFRLTLLAGGAVATRAPIAGDAEARDAARQALDGLRTRRIVHTHGGVDLITDHAPPAPLTVTLDPAGLAATTMNVFAGPASAGGSATLTAPGRPEPLLALDGQVPGCLSLHLSAMAGGARLSRDLCVTWLPPGTRLVGADLPARKAAARALMLERGQMTPARALVLLAEGRAEQGGGMLSPAIEAVERRHDCADFFLLPLLRIWRDHRADLPPALADRLTRAIGGFRYWLDEPGNDVMWFWSENHALCFHAAQHVAGHLMPDAVFAASGRTGRDQERIGRDRLLRWFASVEAHGLAEWNSAAYYPIDFLGLLTLIDMSPDAELVARATALCDRIMAMVALHTVGGVPAGSQGRCYDKELFAGPATELGAMAAIAFGAPWYHGHDRAAAVFAMSRYAPPAGLAGLCAPPPGISVRARYVQGVDANAKLTLWKTAEVQLSSVTDHRTGDKGHQQHVVDLQFAGHPMARVWVNHPGEMKPWGGARPSFWAGSGVVPRVAQHDATALLIFDLDRQAHPIGFTHAHVPHEALDEVACDGGWIFLRSGNGYGAIWCSAPLTRQAGGIEWRAPGRRAGWVILAGDATLDGDFAAFRGRAQASAPRFDAAALRLDVRAGTTALALDHDGPLTADGMSVPFAPVSIHPHVAWGAGDLAPLALGGTA